MRHCPICHRETAWEWLARTEEIQPSVRRLIGAQNPQWSPAQGICPGCALRYAQQLAAERSEESLHTRTFPHTTFPYYHREEITVLPLTERLPDYATFGGSGVTIAFLDSGYYPHPDLIDDHRTVLDLSHSNAEVGRTRRLLERQPLRIRYYVNLFEGSEHSGLDAPSLWSDAPNSWHGQMTSAIAAGNGLLSGGRYRGFAPDAQILPMKIGLANGKIPESEILRGLQWLLRDDNWLRYNVRVVNISVGGDYPHPWWENEICLAVEELTRRGVLVVAAAGNANRHELLPPAQAPSAVTVGGIDDGNRRWQPDQPEEVARLRLYHHNWGAVFVDSWRIPKPELVAPSAWAPAPILPVSAVFREMWILGQAWDKLVEGDLDGARAILWEWRTLLQLEPAIKRADGETLRRALRLRMNPHKFAHSHYQHVDGTSVAAPQVAAVAAQMIEANPSLTPYRVKELLTEAALPLLHLPHEKVGYGVLMPSTAVALALRAHGGALAGYPISGTPLDESGLRNLAIPVKVAIDEVESADSLVPCYVGILASDARAVILSGSFNGWQLDQLPLSPARNGWWHGIFLLPLGRHFYRFWIVDADSGNGRWIFDPENPLRAESGFLHPHSVINIGAV
ncbi:MAG: S8 family serine peptidase [Caldilineaceae bacterium]|nr:S8 family serine peptidase [Caldilineaceae bacterium]